MEDKIYNITLTDGTKLKNLKLNGNNFVSSTPITEEMFEYNTSKVKIESDGETEIRENMQLIQISKIGDEYYFILAEIPKNQLEMQQMQSQIDYIMMMAEIE